MRSSLGVIARLESAVESAQIACKLQPCPWASDTGFPTQAVFVSRRSFLIIYGLHDGWRLRLQILDKKLLILLETDSQDPESTWRAQIACNLPD